MGVDGRDFGLQFHFVFLADWRCRRFVPREFLEVGGAVDSGFFQSLAASEGAHEVVRLPADLVPRYAMTSVIAALDHQQVDVAKLVEVFVAVDADFAYEDAVSVVGC